MTASPPLLANRPLAWLPVRSLATAWISAAMALAALSPEAAQAAERVIGSGKSATESRNGLGEFEAIGLRGSMNLVVRQGSAAGVTVTADDNLLPFVETVVESSVGGLGAPRLVVRWKSGASISTQSNITVHVTTPRLVALASSGSGDIHLAALDTPKLELSLSGSGDATLGSLKTEDLRIAISGSGDVKAGGRAERLRVSIAGSGDVNAAGLEAAEASITIAGSGDVAVHAVRKLAVTIAGSGDVIYSGEPEVTRSVAGSGSVKRR